MLCDLFDRQHEAETQDMVVDNKDEIKDERGSLIYLFEYTLIMALTALEERLAQVEQVFKKASALSEELNQVRDIVKSCRLR
jgi:hypothetical protein